MAKGEPGTYLVPIEYRIRGMVAVRDCTSAEEARRRVVECNKPGGPTAFSLKVEDVGECTNWVAIGDPDTPATVRLGRGHGGIADSLVRIRRIPDELLDALNVDNDGGIPFEDYGPPGWEEWRDGSKDGE